MVRRLFVHVSDREAVDNDNEFYTQSLVGLEVVLESHGAAQEDVVLGAVVDVYDGFGTYDSLKIKARAEGSRLEDVVRG